MRASRIFVIAILFSLCAVTQVSAKNATLGEGVFLNYSSSGAWGCNAISSPPGYPYMGVGANSTGGNWLTAGNSGTFTLNCWNGGGDTSASDVLNVAAPASCTANGTLAWGSCSVYYNGTVSSGNNVTVYNTAPGYSGSQTYNCNNGTWGWVSETCTADPPPPPPPSPSLNYLIGTGCTIAIGGNDCNTRAQWSISNASDPRVYLDGNTAWAWYGASGDNLHNFGAVGPGNHTFSAYDGGTGTTFQTVGVSKSCAGGSTWNGSICAADTCANGATNYPTCTICPAGQEMSGGTCQTIPAVNNPIGNFDGGNCSNMWGWTCDADNYSQALSVHLYEGGTYITAVTANAVREQAVADMCGGVAAHGFNFTPPENLKTGTSRTITAYAINIGSGATNPSLGSAAITCAVPTCANGASNYPTCDTCPAGKVFVGGICTNQSWTSYCTGGSDPFGNNWQVWRYDNADTPNYENTGALCNPTPTFSASPTSVTTGSASTLTWSSVNTTSCTASGDWSGAKATGGSQSTGALTSSQTYGLYCTNTYAQNSAVVNATVNMCANGATNYPTCTTCPAGQTMVGGVCAAQSWTAYCTGGSDVNGNFWQVWEYDNSDTPNYRSTGGMCDPTPSFTASPTSLSYNNASTLTWSSVNTVSCTASGDWSGAKAVSGSQSTGNLSTSKTFGLVCTNSYGQVSPLINASVTTCPFATPTWTGGSCVAPAGTITPSSCTIPTGSSSCTMNVIWSVTNPPGTVEVRRNYDAGSVLATGATGNNAYVFPYAAAPYQLDLYDAARDVLLDDATYTASCATGGWDPVNGECANPSVVSAAVTGQYYSTPGQITFTCSNSDGYVVRNADTNTVISSGAYSGTKTVDVVTSGNYSIVCAQGSYLSAPALRYYNAPPPPLPTIALVASPRTISKFSETVLNWNILFPVNACTFTAKSVCTNGICSNEQTQAEQALTTKLRTESTDSSDPSGSRSMTEAIKAIAPGHQDTDWMALGKKTVRISNTTDISIDCGGGKKATTRVQVTTSNEQ